MTKRSGRCVAAVALAIALAGFGPLEAQQARQGLVSLDDARIFYEIVGSGDPIVVVHGGPGLDHGYLQPGLDALATRNTLIYYDQRGTGRSSAALTASAINLDSFVQDIDAQGAARGVRVDIQSPARQRKPFGHDVALLIASLLGQLDFEQDRPIPTSIRTRSSPTGRSRSRC